MKPFIILAAGTIGEAIATVASRSLVTGFLVGAGAATAVCLLWAPFWSLALQGLWSRLQRGTER